MLRLVGTRCLPGLLICSILVASLLFAPTLNSASSGQGHAFAKGSSVISTSCSTNCPPQQPPVMIGWGGLRLDSATVTSTLCTTLSFQPCYHNTTFVASNVFPGQSQSDTERLVVRMKAMGLNTIRVSFAPYCTNPTNNPPDPSDSVYSLTDAQNTVKIASYYNFWIVLRYDGDNDISTATTCWLNYWQTVIQQVGPLYDQIVWEPINEPGATVSVLSADYQSWINMARSNGDKHFIAIENQCSSPMGCPFWPNAQLGYPTVTDSLGKVLISFHPYYGWQGNSGSWTPAGAIAGAQADYQVMISGEQNTGWQAFNTEGGADPQISDCAGPPDCVLPGSAGYASTTLVYIQTLTNLLDSHSPRIGWVWWPAASWTGTPCAGTYGALQPASCPGGSGYSGGVGWGTLLNFVPVSVSVPPVLSTGFSFQPTSPLVNSAVSFTAITTGGVPPYSIGWDFGDGTVGSGASITHSYTAAGSFTVTETSTDSSALSQSATISHSVTVFTTLPTPPTLTVPANQTVIAGTWINFTVTAGTVNTGGSVIISTTGLPPGATFDPSTGVFSWKPSSSQTGTYTIVFIATDSSSPSTPTSKPMGIQVDQASPGGSNGGNGGSGGGSSGSCPLCGIFPVISSSVGLLIVGGLLGLVVSLALLTIRARATLERRKRRTNQLTSED